MKQAQQMQDEMLQAQEKLKDEIVEASAGGGMVKVTMGGDLTLREITIDPEAIDPEDAEMLAGDGPGGGQRGRCAPPRSWPARRWAGSPAASAADSAASRDVSTEGPAPLARLVAELSRLPGIGQRTAQRLAFHLLRAPDEEAASRSATRSAK